MQNWTSEYKTPQQTGWMGVAFWVPLGPWL